MNKINNKIILISTILAFVFGLSLASPVYAQSTNRNGVIPFSYYYPTQYIPINYYPEPIVYSTPVYYTIPVYITPIVIDGCDERTTGFSTTTGQSCYGNYVNTSTTIVKNYNTYYTTVPTTTTKKITDSVATNNINESYGSLTANALLGSNSFMPSGLIQWIFFALLILAIIFLWRYVHRSEEKYMIKPMKHA